MTVESVLLAGVADCDCEVDTSYVQGHDTVSAVRCTRVEANMPHAAESELCTDNQTWNWVTYCDQATQ